MCRKARFGQAQEAGVLLPKSIPCSADCERPFGKAPRLSKKKRKVSDAIVLTLIVPDSSDSCRPATASTPVASMVWMGLKRLPHRPFCGPSLSKFNASEKTLPLRMSRAAWRISCGEILLSVPISSSAPQRAQFFTRSAPAFMSLSVIFARSLVLGHTPLKKYHRILRFDREPLQNVWKMLGEGG